MGAEVREDWTSDVASSPKQRTPILRFNYSQRNTHLPLDLSVTTVAGTLDGKE